MAGKESQKCETATHKKLLKGGWQLGFGEPQGGGRGWTDGWPLSFNKASEPPVRSGRVEGVCVCRSPGSLGTPVSDSRSVSPYQRLRQA